MIFWNFEIFWSFVLKILEREQSRTIRQQNPNTIRFRILRLQPWDDYKDDIRMYFEIFPVKQDSD